MFRLRTPGPCATTNDEEGLKRIITALNKVLGQMRDILIGVTRIYP
jgi:hypothetical protein